MDGVGGVGGGGSSFAASPLIYNKSNGVDRQEQVVRGSRGSSFAARLVIYAR